MIPTLDDRTPEIITGARGPDARPSKPTETVGGLPQIPKGESIYRSRFRELRLHLGKEKDRWDNRTGERIQGQEYTARFHDHFWRSSSIQDIDVRQEMVRRLEEHPDKGRDFWNVAEMQAQIKRREEEQLEAQLRSNPKLAKRLMARVDADQPGFELPVVNEEPPAPKITSTAPICGVCGKTFKSNLALSGHTRSHKRG